MELSPNAWRHSENCWQSQHATSEDDKNCDCGLSDAINLLYSKDKFPAIESIPVSMIGPWGGPTVVGKADIRGSKDVHIRFDEHELVSEFYDLSEQELIMSISFKYHNS
jgi:hypothetical protein